MYIHTLSLPHTTTRTYTHTHTHTHIYIYIYIYREREREIYRGLWLLWPEMDTVTQV